MFSYEHVMMSSGQRSSLCHTSYFTNKNYTADYKFFQEHQQNSRRFPVFPVFPGVVDTLIREWNIVLKQENKNKKYVQASAMLNVSDSIMSKKFLLNFYKIKQESWNSSPL